MSKVIYVAGHFGMVGSAIVRKLQEYPDDVRILSATREELDLTDADSVGSFFQDSSIDEVYLAAAKVGGIHANSTYPVEFLLENLQIQINVISMAHSANINKLLFLGSSCIYPKLAEQPMREDQLLTGSLEPTNEPYALAKIAGIKLCESYNREYGRDYRSVMPTNLYGPNDNFHPENSHLLPALIRRFHEAKLNGSEEVVVWGTGTPQRELLHVDDMSAACIHVMNIEQSVFAQNIDARQSHINVGTGVDHSIKEIASMVARTVGYEGNLVFDTSKPDGTPRKVLDVEKLKALGWSSTITLEEGLVSTYEWYLNNIENVRK